MADKQITAMDLHGALSSLLFAVNEEMGPLGHARISYSEGVYLQVHVEVVGLANMQAVAARLVHGVLWGPFDYRFTCVGHPWPEHVGPLDRVEVSAMVDLSNSKAPSGPINFNETPSRRREAAERAGWGWSS